MFLFFSILNFTLFIIYPYSKTPNKLVLYLFLYIIFIYINYISKKDNFLYFKKVIYFDKSILINKYLKVFIYCSYIFYIVHLGLLQYYHFNSFFLTENDVVSITEIILETERGNLFSAHHFGDPDLGNYLSHHFSPILAIFVPFMSLFPYKMAYCNTLLIFTGLGLWLWEKVLSRLEISKDIYFYLAIFPIYNSYIYNLNTGYHYEITILFFFFLILYGIFQRNYVLEFLGLCFLLMIKEDMPIYVILFATTFLFQKKVKKFVIYFGISILYFLLIYIVQSNLDSSAKVNWISAWSHWGNTPLEIMSNFLMRPMEVLSILFEKRNVLVNLFGSFGFIPLLHIPSLGALVVLFSLHIFSSKEWYNSFYHYYSYTVLPFLLYSILMLGRKISEKPFEKKSIFILLFWGSVFYSLKGNRDFPQKIGTFDRERVKETQAVVEKIPKNASVNVFFDMGMHLRKDIRVYSLKKDFLKDFILLDTRGWSPYYPIDNINEDIEKYLKEKKILLYYSVGSVKLYKRKEER